MGAQRKKPKPEGPPSSASSSSLLLVDDSAERTQGHFYASEVSRELFKTLFLHTNRMKAGEEKDFSKRTKRKLVLHGISTGCILI